MGRHCAFRKDDRQMCQAAPLKECEHCFWHSPEYAEDVAEAPRLGGLRRRREVAVSGGLENSVARARTLAYLAMTAIKLLEVGEPEQRLAGLEAAIHGQKRLPESVFDTDQTDRGLPLEADS